MKKLSLRLMSVLLVLTCMIFSCVTSVSARDLTADEIRAQISSVYQKCLNSRGSSFKGYCGDYIGWQLYHMGINTSNMGVNGNVTFEKYKDLSVTTGGFSVTAYPSSQYTLKSALKAISNNGTKNVYNILVCMEKGNTESAQDYGHAVFIHAIINGMVYFSESGNLSYGKTIYYEGTPICMSIDQVCDSVWMYTYQGNVPVFDGVIHFQGGGSAPSASILTISGVNYPIQKASGAYFTVYGLISSPYILELAEALVYDINGEYKFGIGTYAQDGRKTYNIKDFETANMAFRTLSDGQYKYIIRAWDERGYYAYFEKTFTVGGTATTSASAPTITATHSCDLKPGTPYSWDSGKVTKEPECEYRGVKIYTCKECGNTKMEWLPAIGSHSFGPWEITKPATREEDGEMTRKCSVCFKRETQTIPRIIKYGDVDNSDEISATDALLTLQYTVEKIDFNDDQCKLADVDASGKVTANDALLILQRVVGKITVFPVENQ